ncbi:monocarboxylate transporter 12-B [Erpetoichthys calabaricus]|uniref:Monocarboxylate transporter 12 n=1 Tax=Erpetoichthys calabaricus TaxID=27687 RepID=A0A8C4RM26_ERPCA|nr:monocarboxylate transporter 12-B [Erpetoichthys calabaricus]
MALTKKVPIAAPPDGGWGWMIVAGCFLVTICTRAVTRCISIFFVEFQLYFGQDYSRTAWIHSLADCATMLCAPLGSLIGNQLSCRVAIILGGIMASIGLILSSFATSLEYLYLTLGVLTGVGFALCYTPAIAMVGKYFIKRKALAYGIAMSGSGIGTFILAPVVQLLIEHYSWRGALFLLGGLVANLCVCGALMRPISLKEEEINGILPTDEENIYSKQHNDLSALSVCKTDHTSKNDCNRSCLCLQSLQEYKFLLMPDFMVLAVSFLFLAYGCSIPFVYLVPYSLSVGLSPQHAAFLMSVLGIIDIIGNITFGWLTDRRCLKKYRHFCYLFAVGMDGICCLFIPVLRSFPLLVPFSVLYGYFDGAYVALMPVITSDVVGTKYLSSALGVVYFLHAIPYLVSPPIAGLLVDNTGTYTAAFLQSGFSMIFSSFLLVSAKLIKKCLTNRSNSSSTGSDPKLQIFVNNTEMDYSVAKGEECKMY